MNKQEEIGKEVFNFIYTGLVEGERYGDIADSILYYLHSQGVVIKVEKELPITTGLYGKPLPINGSDDYNKGQIKGQQDMLDAGYVAVESLIEEEK